MINESLYKTGSQDALQMMREDPEVFKEAGYNYFLTFPFFKHSLVSLWIPLTSAVMAN